MQGNYSPEVILGPGVILGSPGVILAQPGVILGSSWSNLWVILDHFESSWGHPGVILESSLGHPGDILSHPGNIEGLILTLYA